MRKTRCCTLLLLEMQQKQYFQFLKRQGVSYFGGCLNASKVLISKHFQFSEQTTTAHAQRGQSQFCRLLQQVPGLLC